MHFQLGRLRTAIAWMPFMMRVHGNSVLDMDVEHFKDQSLGLGCVTDFLSVS